MTWITYHLLANPFKLERLRAEVATLGLSLEADSEPTLAQLESLPYLKAVVREGLRLHGGITARSQRIAPHEALQYKQWMILPGAPVICISIFMHYNADTFPEPRAFKPERWLVERNEKELERYFVAFGKGPRSSLGYNLALAEIYMMLAAVLCKFEMHLFETYFDDVNMERDWFVPQPKVNTKGVRVIVVRQCLGIKN